MTLLDRLATRASGLLGPDRMGYQEKKRLQRVSLYVVVGVTIFAFFFPIYWMLVASLQSNDLIIKSPLYWPWEVLSAATVESWVRVFTDRNFSRWYLNSLLVAGISIVVTVATATLAGYGLTRVKFRGRKMFARLILFSYMFPPILLAFPQFQIWQDIGLLNTYWGIAIAHIALALPFSIWAMWKFFQTVPIAYEEAVWMNGGTRFHSFKDVALPMAWPGMVAVAIFTFAVSWNDFTMATILLPEPRMQTLPPAIQTFQEQNFVFWGQMMAASVLISIPPFVLVYKLQESILEGFKTGGL